MHKLVELKSRDRRTSHQLDNTCGVGVPWESGWPHEVHVLADSYTSVGKMDSSGPRVSSAIMAVDSSVFSASS